MDTTTSHKIVQKSVWTIHKTEQSKNLDYNDKGYTVEYSMGDNSLTTTAE